MSYDFSPGYKIRDQYAPHFLTFTVMGWIDIFSRRIYRDIILESMHFCQSNKDLKIGAYVIMTNHIHTIWTSPSGHLSDTIRDFKTFTSKAITKAINEEPESRREWLDFMFKFYANATNKNDLYKLWTNNNHPEAIYSKEFLFTKMHYIHQNPVKAGLVAKGQDYIYSSASNYLTGEGIFKVDLFY
jgi:REP element-mobilizing transposase RayT